MKNRRNSVLFRLIRFLTNISFGVMRRICFWSVNMPDEKYLKKQFFSKMGMRLSLENPITFNEKLQWLKLYDRNSLYTELVDKIRVKEYVSEKLGEEYIIPTIAIWDSVDDINFDILPEQFVIKCNHDSGGIFICKNKSLLTEKDKKKALKRLRKHMNNNYYSVAREWAYKDVDRKIFAEKYMEDESGRELKDYKIFNFNGKARMIQVDYNRFIKHQRSMYTPEWELMKQSFCYKTNADVDIEKPSQLDKMLECAASLSDSIPFVRTDFYSIGDRIYFGEMTFYPEAGYGEFFPYEYDNVVGEWLTLPERRN